MIKKHWLVLSVLSIGLFSGIGLLVADPSSSIGGNWGIVEAIRNFVGDVTITGDLTVTGETLLQGPFTAQSSGSVDNMDVVNAFTAGTIASDATVVAATGMTATTGNITATAGNVVATAGAVSAGTTVTGGTGVVATTGGVTATAGGVTATAGGITATTGNIVATAGSVQASTGVVITGTGDIDSGGGGNKIIFDADGDSYITDANFDDRYYLYLGGGFYITVVGSTKTDYLNTIMEGAMLFSEQVSYEQGTFAADATTPSVATLSSWKTAANTGATAITALSSAAAGQMVILCGGSNTNSSTIADSGNFNLSAAITLATDTCITLYTADGTNWKELARSVN